MTISGTVRRHLISLVEIRQASRLAERGVSLEDIAAVLGQKSSKVAQIYTELADRTRRADAVITKLRPTEK